LLDTILINQSFLLAWEKEKKKVCTIVLTHVAGAVLPARQTTTTNHHLLPCASNSQQHHTGSTLPTATVNGPVTQQPLNRDSWNRYPKTKSKP